MHEYKNKVFGYIMFIDFFFFFEISHKHLHKHDFREHLFD